jgi:hypothetical protein
MDPRIRIRIKKRYKYGTLAKAPEKTVWKDNIGKDKREGKRGRQGEDTGENKRQMRVKSQDRGR